MAYIVWRRCSNPWEVGCNSRGAVDGTERGVWVRELVACPESALVKRTASLPTVLTSQDTSSLWRKSARNEFFILKIHGDINRPDTVILSSRDYTQHVFGNLAFMQFLQRIFMSKSILFVGTSLGDVYIRRFLEETTFLTEGVGMLHFAILPNTGSIRSRLLRDKFNIHVITYDLADFDGDHQAAVERILQRLR